MGTGSSVSTGDGITAAKMNAKLEDVDQAELGTINYIEFTSGSLPAGTSVYIGEDGSGDVTINALTAKQVHIAIAGTDEFNFSGTEFELASGNNIQFLGDDDIVDSNGNELITFSATSSAVNGLQIKNAASGNAPQIGSNGASAEADIGLDILDSNGNELLRLSAVASAVNELTIKNAATGNQPIIMVSGEADTGVEIQNAAGEVMLETVSTSAPVNWLSVSNADTGNPVILLNPGEDDVGFQFQAKNAEEILDLAAVAGAKNYLQITSSATRSPQPASSISWARSRAVARSELNMRRSVATVGMLRWRYGMRGVLRYAVGSEAMTPSCDR